MQQVRRPLITVVAAALALTALAPSAAGAATRFESRNNYAVASGTLSQLPADDSGHRIVRVRGSLVDTRRHPATSYAYLSYYDTFRYRWENRPIACARNGRREGLHHEYYICLKEQPYVIYANLRTVRVTVCTSRSGWHCGNPSPRS